MNLGAHGTWLTGLLDFTSQLSIVGSGREGILLESSISYLGPISFLVINSRAKVRSNWWPPQQNPVPWALTAEQRHKEVFGGWAQGSVCLYFSVEGWAHFSFLFIWRPTISTEKRRDKQNLSLATYSKEREEHSWWSLKSLFLHQLLCSSTLE